MMMKPRWYLRNPRAMLCWFIGHTPDPSTVHTFCGSDTKMMFCKRCAYLYSEKDGGDGA